MKAAVLGASGGIGQPLSLLLKTSHLVTELALYDIKGTPGVSADLSHIATSSEVSGYLPENDGLRRALTGAGIVVIPAGVPRQPGMTCRDDLFRLNAGIIKSLAEGIAQWAPDAFVLVITNPVNSTLPIMAEVLKKNGVFNPARVFGVTTLDVVRAQTFVKPYAGVSPAKVTVPVIGGHSNETIVPLFSQAQPPMEIPSERLDALTDRVQRGGEEVVQAKGGFNSATLSMAFAGFRLAEKVMRAAYGETGLVEPTFLSIADIPGGEDVAAICGTEFFSVPVEFGREGAIFAQNPLPDVSEYEANLLKECIQTLRKNIAKGVAFAYQDDKPKRVEEPVISHKVVIQETVTPIQAVL